MIITWKGVLKTVQHNTVLFVMESRSNCTCNIHKLSSEKEVNWKENTVGKIARRRQIQKSTHDQILIEWSAGRLPQIVKILRDFMEQIVENQRQSQIMAGTPLLLKP